MAGIPKLIILSEQFRGRAFELTQDLHTVGRVDERDICIKDPTVSTYHCVFIRNPDGSYTIKDQGSTNGTRVNNVPITEQVLQNSDILQIGGVEILYDCDDKSVTTVLRTQTGIDLDAGGATNTIKRLNVQQSGGASKGKLSQKLLFLVLVVLLLLVIGLIALLVYLMKSGNEAGMIVSPLINLIQ